MPGRDQISQAPADWPLILFKGSLNVRVEPNGYPALFSYLHDLGWLPGRPIREVYLSAAAANPSDEFLTEVQIPWATRAE